MIQDDSRWYAVIIKILVLHIAKTTHRKRDIVCYTKYFSTQLQFLQKKFVQILKKISIIKV